MLSLGPKTQTEGSQFTSPPREQDGYEEVVSGPKVSLLYFHFVLRHVKGRGRNSDTKNTELNILDLQISKMICLFSPKLKDIS